MPNLLEHNDMRRLRVVVAGCGLFVSLAVVPPSPAAPAPPSEKDRTVTLVTGDQVVERRVPGGPAVYLPRAGNGRGEVQFLQYGISGHHYVIPADAARLVAAGKLDEQLFDVPRLLAEGDGAELRLVVQHDEQAASLGTARRLESLPGSAVRVPAARAASTWSALTGPGVSRVWLDHKVQVSLRDSMPQIGMPAAWSAGYTGKGVKVAVLDTGVDADHPDITGAVVAQRDFTGSPSGTADRYGHGTHVSSIIRGTGAASGGHFRGGAPATSLLSGKVLDDWGSGYVSWVVAGMEWAAGNGAQVVNLSLGTSVPSAGDDVMSVAVDRLTKQTGALFVVAAGNNPSVMGSPAAAREALTVGAVTKQDVVAGFSSRGPRAFDSLLKPEIAAPGVDITAARANGTEMGTPVDDRHTTASGTSMAAPHVAAAAAVLAESRPGWKAPELKAALMSTSKALPGETVYAQGAGRVDVARILRQTVHASPGGVSFGQVYDDELSQVVTVHNTATAAVALRLAVDVRDSNGKPAPAGMFGTGADTVVVPAAGTAEVTVRAGARTSAPPGNYSGWLVGSSADDHTVVRVPIALTKEAVPHHDIDLVTLDSAGKAATGYPICVGLETGERCRFVQREDGRVSARVPAGRHLVATNVFEQGQKPDTWQVSAIVRPVSIRQDSTFVLDARTARRSEVTVDRPGSTDLGAMLTVACDTPAGKAMFSAAAARLSDLRVAPAKDESGSSCRSTFGTVLVSEKDSYHLVFPSVGDIPTPMWTVRDDQLAVVEARSAAQGSVRQHAVKTVSPISDGWFVVPWNSLKVPLPGVRTEYRSPGPWIWYTYFNTYTDDGETFLSQQIANTTYPAAGRVAERWNAAVFGPSLAPVDSTAYRFGNTVLFQIPLYGDQSPDHSGYLPGMTGTVSLFRDHDLIGPGSLPFGNVSAWAQVPAEPGRYRLVVDAEQSAPGTPLSRRISAEWTFHSGYADDTTQISLPLQVVRFAPPVDERNTAPAGQELRVPVTVQRVAGAPPSTIMGISVFASYDDGGTWYPVQLIPTATGWDAVLHHPPGARTVSLRTTATDAGDNSVQQTIMRAYELR
ncbi:S8 family serine peptidase [Lentzea sp. PSKA42]|uniref:S8 family serine peptidase n=1 Tax=Lentzea indica TaxID=2604800 RepID=A0ABX1FTD4_9PSEU|nr:S8 family serine peptidase [Lentzea indica]NKE62290.1 S8 family serine peptidase [Lentzea indica]